MVKKVCHLLISYGNKNQKYTSDLIEGLNRLSKDEHFVFCHHTNFKTTEIKVIVSNIKRREIKVYFNLLGLYLSDKNFRELFGILNYKELRKWIWLIAYQINVLHIHHEHAIPIEVLTYLKKTNVKIILSLRGRDLLLNTDTIDKHQDLGAKILLSDIIHCISHYMNDKLFSLFQIHGTVIHRGQPVPLDLYIKRNKNDSTVIKMICVGRLVWEKGHIYLIESVNRLKSLGYLFEVDIFGDGNLKEFLSFRIKQLNLENEIHLKGFVKNDDLKTTYKNYDLAIQPSLSEALSNGLIDFRLHNLPCVISNVGGMIEVIENNENGIIFDSNDMTSMDTAILQAKSFNLDRLSKFNENSKFKFSSEQEMKSLLKIYA